MRIVRTIRPKITVTEDFFFKGCDPTGNDRCPECEGHSGWFEMYSYGPPENYTEEWVDCPACLGTGEAVATYLGFSALDDYATPESADTIPF